jgi:hypothetical protein
MAGMSEQSVREVCREVCEGRVGLQVMNCCSAGVKMAKDGAKVICETGNAHFLTWEFDGIGVDDSVCKITCAKTECRNYAKGQVWTLRGKIEICR